MTNKTMPGVYKLARVAAVIMQILSAISMVICGFVAIAATIGGFINVELFALALLTAVYVLITAFYWVLSEMVIKFIDNSTKENQ